MHKEKNKPNSWKKLRWVLLPVSVYLAFLMWQHWPKSRNVPVELIGEWRTSDPKYEGRSFEIGLVSVSYGTGEGGSHTGIIEKVEGVFDGSGTAYTISYKEDDVENQLTFYYSEKRGKTITLRNQPNIVWSKVKEF